MSEASSVSSSQRRTMRIGELAAVTAVSARSLRYYEQQGLLASCRNRGGQRTYNERAVDRVVLIQNFFAAGLCGTRIRALLECLDGQGEANGSGVGDQLTIELRRLDTQLRDLTLARATLVELRERLTICS
jgi:DNA-binding transcriptional MerR regulator